MCTEHEARQASRMPAVSTWPLRNESGGARCVRATGCFMDTLLQMETGGTQEMRTQKGGRQGRPSQPQKHMSLPLGRSHTPRDEVPTPKLFSREELSPPSTHRQHSRQRRTGGMWVLLILLPSKPLPSWPPSGEPPPRAVPHLPA